ncbi:MAG: hypothetical protein ACRCU6_12410 [Fusobacteriaceae bacterium]
MADKNKKLSAVLEFKDGFSAVVKKAGDGVRKVGSEAGRAASGVRGLGSAFSDAGINVDAFNSKVKKVGSNLASSAFNKAKSALKGLAVGAVATGSAMTVMGFKAASSIEQYKNTLDTVLKDPKKASATLEWANKFADETPFQNKEVMDATVKLHAYKLDPQVFLKTIGDTAATMGKSLDQAVEAFADASNGELERLKEFGIKKNDVIDFGEKIGLKDFVDSKGTITDANKFMLSLSKLMEDRHKDGMEKQSKTVAGLWSTILGKSQSALAKFVGMNRDGSSRAGSAFELFKSKLETVVNKFNEMEKDGTLERWTKKIDKEIVPAVNKAFESVSKWVKDCITWFQELDKTEIKEWKDSAVEAISAVMSIAKELVPILKVVGELFKPIQASIDLGKFLGQGTADMLTLGKTAENRHEKKEQIKTLESELGVKEKTDLELKSPQELDKILKRRQEEYYKTDKGKKEKAMLDSLLINTPDSTEIKNNAPQPQTPKMLGPLKEKVIEKTKTVAINITGPININNGMDVETLANRIALASMTQY